MVAVQGSGPISDLSLRTQANTAELEAPTGITAPDSLALETGRASPTANAPVLHLAQATSEPRATSAIPRRLALPRRSPEAPTGSQFLAELGDATGHTREVAIVNELLSGNVPSHLRRFTEIQMTSGGHDVRFFALPDYLAIGSDDDYFIVPMTGYAAQRVADLTGTLLPTSRLVHAIFEDADETPTAHPFPPSDRMVHNSVFAEHNEIMLQNRPSPHDGRLYAGDRKNVIIHRNSLANENVTIYGFYRADDTPWQNPYSGHDYAYSDYSHAVRLLGDYVEIDGQRFPLSQALRSETLGPLLTNDGPYPPDRLPSYSWPQR